MYKVLITITILALLFGGCVSNKKVQYLQHNDVNAENLQKDTVLRSYNTAKKEYKIQPYDILSIDFKSLTEEEFDFFKRGGIDNSNSTTASNISGELVDTKGEIEYPVIGKIKIEGLTIFEAQDTLQSIANEFLKEAVVKVRLLNFRFTILGEVKQEGTISSYDNQISILEGIGLAGGLSDLADRSNVKIIRNTKGLVEIQYVNLLDEAFINSPFYYIHQNDIILLPPLKQRTFRKYATQNTSLILSSISAILLAINLLRR